MWKPSDTKNILDEIALLIQYAVGAEDKEIAHAVVQKYRDNHVALQVLRDFYLSLPEAREEPLTRIVRIDMRQGVFLLGVRARAHEYIYFATEEDAGCLGEYREGIGDPEILAFFGYTSNESFLEIHPTFAEFADLDTMRNEEGGVCPVCRVAIGEYHHLGCPVEVCPWCLGQLNRCNCRFDQLEKEEIIDDEDLARFEKLLQEKGRVCFEADQAPSYPSAGKDLKKKKKKP
jgi:hypothetical protein